MVGSAEYEAVGKHGLYTYLRIAYTYPKPAERSTPRQLKLLGIDLVLTIFRLV